MNQIDYDAIRNLDLKDIQKHSSNLKGCIANCEVGDDSQNQEGNSFNNSSIESVDQTNNNMIN